MHTLSAAYLTTAFVVGAVGAWHLLKDRANPRARLMFSMAMWMAAIVAPLQIVLGDMHGLNTLEHQPVKVMAMEGHYQSHPDGAPLILFGIPNSAEGRVDYAVEIPKLSSLILKHDLNAPLQGLDTVPAADHPPVGIGVLGLSHHGRPGLSDGRPGHAQPVGPRPGAAVRMRSGCTASPW